jgi:CheY-like chemotaxis protein
VDQDVLQVTKIVRVTEDLLNAIRQEHPRVLVVEDDREEAELIRHGLEDIGCAVEIAFDAMRAMEALFDSNKTCNPDFDIVFLDLKLPGEGGISLLRKIRVTTPRLPVVVVTGYATDKNVSDAARLGYVGFIEKPVTASDLREIMLKHKIN